MFEAAISWYSAHAGAVFMVVTVTLVAGELGGGWLRRRMSRADVTSSVTSLTSGLTFLVVKFVVGKLAVTTALVFVYDRYRLTTLDLGDPWVWVGVMTLRDFVYYWVHLAEHRVRVLWASHMVHHSPETIGYTSAVRIPWMEALYKPVFSIWVPLIGFHPVAAIALDAAAATMAQLYHTERWNRIPVLDTIFVMPAAHRVHHGSNPEYVDKNFGAVFIFWDKLFGTYEPERARVAYGIGQTKVDTPVKALTGGYPAVIGALRSIPNWGDRLRYAMAPPGKAPVRQVEHGVRWG